MIDAAVTSVAGFARITGMLLRACADAADAFARSVTISQEMGRCPDLLPDWVDDGSAPLL